MKTSTPVLVGAAGTGLVLTGLLAWVLLSGESESSPTTAPRPDAPPPTPPRTRHSSSRSSSRKTALTRAAPASQPAPTSSPAPAAGPIPGSSRTAPASSPVIPAGPTPDQVRQAEQAKAQVQANLQPEIEQLRGWETSLAQATTPRTLVAWLERFLGARRNAHPEPVTTYATNLRLELKGEADPDTSLARIQATRGRQYMSDAHRVLMRSYGRS